jgi:protein farnesyltransferase/geranylgeranyltransferase type-1 subunit alpha
VRIDYSAGFIDAMGYFRALLKSGELSERTLTVTEAVIGMNPANYTAWHLRRRALEALGDRWEEELQYTDDFAMGNPKVYQLWHHRRIVVLKVSCLEGRSGAPVEELVFTARVLNEGEKNYHCWAHRQWAVECFGLWDGEIPFTEALIQRDPKNNSAWNQRYWVIKSTEALPQQGAGAPSPVADLPPLVVRREEAYARAAIEACADNECPWTHLRAVLGPKGAAAAGAETLAWVEAALAANPASSRHALAFLFDHHHGNGNKEKAAQHLKSLITADPVRKAYWAMMQREALTEMK